MRPQGKVNSKHTMNEKTGYAGKFAIIDATGICGTGVLARDGQLGIKTLIGTQSPYKFRINKT